MPPPVVVLPLAASMITEADSIPVVGPRLPPGSVTDEGGMPSETVPTEHPLVATLKLTPALNSVSVNRQPVAVPEWVNVSRVSPVTASLKVTVKLGLTEALARASALIVTRGNWSSTFTVGEETSTVGPVLPATSVSEPDSRTTFALAPSAIM